MVNQSSRGRYRTKALLVAVLRAFFQATRSLRKALRGVVSHARLSSDLVSPLPVSVVVLGRVHVYGTGAVTIGDNCLFYPDVHLETQGSASITLGDGVVISRGVHLVAMSDITIGDGSMVGEYASIRDANHQRCEGVALRDAGHISKPIVVGREVWIGRGVVILSGVSIGDHATVGANAVVTHHVSEGSTVVGVPAKPIRRL
jgi:acetyltransferase-like isoleucine patch superfamily enzyme